MKLAEYKSLLTTLQRPGAMSDQIARKWFVTQARSLNTRPRSILTSEQENLTNKIKLGYLYLFFYEPKYKSNLKYFDKYPLTIPIELKENGFTGLNLHYISPTQRLVLIENLRPLIMNENVSNRQRLRISHRILQSSRRYKYYKPCVKNYLYNNCKSLFLKIQAEDWQTALMLPTERFIKKNKKNVWIDSRRTINGHR
mgnify:CR=1 FL=1